MFLVIGWDTDAKNGKQPRMTSKYEIQLARSLMMRTKVVTVDVDTLNGGTAMREISIVYRFGIIGTESSRLKWDRQVVYLFQGLVHPPYGVYCHG